jgi:hypothetical protein
MRRKLMKTTTISLILLVWLFGFTQPVGAQEIEYWGRYSDREAGLTRITNTEYEVSPGVELPGGGTVVQITDAFLVVDIQLSEVDKETLRLQGAAVYDNLQLHIPNRWAGIVPVPRP